MIDLLKVLKCATATDNNNLYKALGELSANEVRTVDDLREYLTKKTCDAMIKRAKL